MDKKFLPINDRLYLDSKGYQYKEINDGPLNGLIIDKFPLKNGKFSINESSLLILIPQGYPDVPPDMFYFSPELHLSSSNSFPVQANVFVDHFQIKWQRWSRHADASTWRPGIDGIYSYIQRVKTALNNA